MKKVSKLLGLLLCCVMLLGLLPATAFAATADETPLTFSFAVDKTVTKGGNVAPGEETFTFELAYGTIVQNEQHSWVFTPDDSVSLADCGIAFTTNTITTNGEGEQTFTLGGTIDPTKVTAENHWQFSSGNDSVPKWIITLRLTEKNDGKAGWTYSKAERYLTITVKGDKVTTDVHILGNDVSDNDFENTYTNSVAGFSFTVDKTVVQGGSKAPGKETFAFELVYGIIGENEQHSVVFTPDKDVTLADCGITFTNNTITTNGVGEKTFTLGGTIDLSKVDAAHHWEDSTGNDNVPKWGITLRLTEKNDGKAGWTYSKAERYLTITVTGDKVTTDVHIMGNDVSDNNFENIYTRNVSSTTNTTNTVESAKTADAGIALYAGLAILSMTGSAGVVLRRRKNDK